MYIVEQIYIEEQILYVPQNATVDSKSHQGNILWFLTTTQKDFFYVLKFVFAKFMFIQNGLAMKFQTCKAVQWY